jgi:endonuclease/exonuclease/phosphatase family metal-dependent hydrolase
MHKTIGVSAFVLAGVAFLTDHAHAASGGFSTVTYNIAGLPQGFSSASSDRQAATQLTSCYVNQFDIVNVQEDFNYHAALYDSCNNHPFRSATSGGVAFGSGLNSMSRFWYDDWERVKWNACNGVDCLTPKGFTLARVRLAEGVFVDVYNLHAQAAVEEADLAARRANMLQLANHIEAFSAGRAVIVMGDTNTRYTRAGDNPRELLQRGFSDVWLSRLRNGDIPPVGEALVCHPTTTSANCEIVDKVLYRDNGFVGLTPTLYDVRMDAKNSAGQELSDHFPVHVDWSYSTPSDLALSDAWGGPHGAAFDDTSLLPDSPVVRTVTLQAGARVDRVETRLTNGYVFSHGGDGGTQSSLSLGDGEYLTSLRACSGQHHSHTRVFHAELTTNQGRRIAGGTATTSCATYTAPAGFQIVAFHGRSAEEVDRLGVVYARRGNVKPAPAPSFQIVNHDSGLCLDITGAKVASGSNLQVWDCNGGDWQRFSYDAKTGLIRSRRDPRYCLDNGGQFANGAGLIVWACNGNAHQRFTLDESSGTIRVRSYADQVLDAYGSLKGARVGTWSFWGGDNQRWSLVP